MKKNLIIISAGQLGRETYNWATQAINQGAPWSIKGFLDTRPGALDGYEYDTKILGCPEHYQIEESDVFVGAIGDPGAKLKYYTPILERDGHFVNVIHPKANVGKNVQLGTGIVLAPFASVTCDAQIGSHVSIGSFSNAGHDTTIGEWSQVSSHCGINGGVTIEKRSFIGSHACLVPQIRIGAGAYVGAGSVVLKSIEPGTKVFGNPALQVGKVS